jgi:hypothetical protein
MRDTGTHRRTIRAPVRLTPIRDAARYQSDRRGVTVALGSDVPIDPQLHLFLE